MAQEIKELEKEIAKLKGEHSLGGRLIQEADRYRMLVKLEDKMKQVRKDKDSVTKSVYNLQTNLSECGLDLRKKQNDLDKETQKLWVKFWEQCKTELKILEPHW